jgi:hypothetical protein
MQSTSHSRPERSRLLLCPSVLCLHFWSLAKDF